MNTIEADTVILSESSATGGVSLSGTQPNLVRAWRVEVHGIVKTYGQDLTIVAKELAFLGGAIDGSGIDAPKTYRAGDKASPGQPGAQGGDGTNAGSIALYAAEITGPILIKAQGGAGGRGQDGGDGEPATDVGPPGPRIRGESPPCSPPAGGQGPQGGQPGYAGPSGKSGFGGSLNIWLLASSKPAAPSMSHYC